MTAGILYLSYSGMLEPLGQSQVLAYQELLAKKHPVHIVSFERGEDLSNHQACRVMQQRMKAAGIIWYPLKYHKRFSALATAWDILVGTVVGLRLAHKHKLGIVHARSYVSSVMALGITKALGKNYIFDMRGFWADERVDGGLWPAGGRMYRVAKWFERQFLLNADCVVSLTQVAVDEMRTFPYLQERMPRFERITTCADLGLFRPRQLDSESPPPQRPFTLGYVGSVGVWYLFDETLRCFKLLRERQPDARLHILNRGGHDYVRERLEVMNIDPTCVQLETADHVGVASAMQQMDAGIFFYKPSYSKKATAPTKLGEFLGCGVPCLGNSGVGDMATILEGEGVGVALSSFDDAAMREAVDRLLQLTQTSGIAARCRDVAMRHFSLEAGVAAYDRIYQELSSTEE